MKTLTRTQIEELLGDIDDDIMFVDPDDSLRIDEIIKERDRLEDLLMETD